MSNQLGTLTVASIGVFFPSKLYIEPECLTAVATVTKHGIDYLKHQFTQPNTMILNFTTALYCIWTCGLLFKFITSWGTWSVKSLCWCWTMHWFPMGPFSHLAQQQTPSANQQSAGGRMWDCWRLIAHNQPASALPDRAIKHTVDQCISQ